MYLVVLCMSKRKSTKEFIALPVSICYAVRHESFGPRGFLRGRGRLCRFARNRPRRLGLWRCGARLGGRNAELGVLDAGRRTRPAVTLGTHHGVGALR